MNLKTVRTIKAVRELSREASKAGKSVALVPTMGGLHDGHLSLVRKAREIADIVIVSLFVNPTQFNNPDDLKTYPGDEDTDINALKKIGTDIVFAPPAEEMYPAGFATKVNISAAENILCDAHRPGHFDGVATIVTKLFLQVEPDFACFGEKDYQQLFIIRTLVRDLNIPVKIVPVETVRETSGLALSSRNARLSKEEHKHAPQLNKAMRHAAKNIASGENPIKATDAAKETLEKDGRFKVEYLEYRSQDNLALLEKYQSNGRLFVAAWLGNIRLIDNIPVNT